MSLVTKKCTPCSGGVPPLKKDEIELLMKELSPRWRLTHGGKRLLRKENFDDFLKPMAFANQIGKMAEEQWHHPELHIGHGHLDIEVWTHKINGLVESDFIFASKVDRILEG